MSAAFSKLGPLSVGSSLSGFEPHIEELHDFFKSRGVSFGSAADLKPFVDRLDSDSGFRDEAASMVRTIIYRERDGLAWTELMELVAAAVGGPRIDAEAGPEDREAVRRVMVFVEGVFRTRKNPGAVNSVAAVRPVEPEPQEHKQPEVAATDERKAKQVNKLELADDSAAEETVLHPDLHGHIPFEDFEDRRTAERGSPAWLWVAGICALLLAFSAGLFVHQRLFVPLRAANTPYQAPPSEVQQQPSTIPPAAVSATERADAIPVAKSGSAVRPTAVSDVNQLPRYMAPAAMGTSPAVMEARLVYAPPAGYPMMAEMTRTQGKVLVEAVIGKSGRVIRARALSGHRLLRGAAVREVYARRYRPYLVNDRPTNVATMVTVDFRLKR